MIVSVTTVLDYTLSCAAARRKSLCGLLDYLASLCSRDCDVLSIFEDSWPTQQTKNNPSVRIPAHRIAPTEEYNP